MQNDVDISPLPELAHLYNEEFAKEKYRKMTAHGKLMEELSATMMTSDINKKI